MSQNTSEKTALPRLFPSWQKINILNVLPREGTKLTDTGSFVIMDILVRLSDGSYANVEMQKIGYYFPLARADCYASDIQKTNSDSLFPLQIFIKIFLFALTFSVQSYIL